MSDCCPTDKKNHNHDSNDHDHNQCHKAGFDFLLWGSISTILLTLTLSALPKFIPSITTTMPFGWDYIKLFSDTTISYLSTMWWGIAIGIFFVGLMSKMPREYFAIMLGKGDTFSGIIRAVIAGLLLDLCSHGILMIGAKLYERGTGIAQIMTFLIASPWNSLSMTLILIALIGLKWTFIFIAASALIAILTGIVFQILVKRKILPENPNRVEIPEGFSIIKDAKTRLKGFKLNKKFVIDIIKNSRHETRILLRWLLLGVIIAASMRTFIPTDHFAEWFGPTLLGLLLTLVATTIIEVCSEGSSPIAAEIMNSAGAPGNAFTFLMAGVSTDYTEIMIIKDTTKSWKIALFLPLVTVPQVVLLGYIMNVAG